MHEEYQDQYRSDAVISRADGGGLVGELTEECSDLEFEGIVARCYVSSHALSNRGWKLALQGANYRMVEGEDGLFLNLLHLERASRRHRVLVSPQRLYYEWFSFSLHLVGMFVCLPGHEYRTEGQKHRLLRANGIQDRSASSKQENTNHSVSSFLAVCRLLLQQYQ